MSQRKIKLKRKLELGEVNIATSVKHIGEKLNVASILRNNLVFLVMLTIGIIVLFANGMNANFVSDDYATLLNNPEITTWKYAFQNGGSAYIINTLVAKIFGVTPLFYHLSSLVLYLISFYLAFVLIYHLFDKTISYLTISLFAVAPIHVEAVTWISGRPYLLIAIYVLLAVIFFIKYLETEKWQYLIGFGLSFLLGFLTDNPRPFSLFLIMPLLLILKNIDIRKYKLFKYWPWLLILITTAVFMAWPNIMSRINAVNSGTNASESVFYNPLFQYPTGLTKYFQLLWFPIDLTLYHTMYVLPGWLNWAILLIYLSMVSYFYFKNKKYFFSLAFIFVSVLPSMAPVKVSWLVAERYIYLGSLGFYLFLGLIVVDMSKYFKIIPVILFLSYMILGVVRTFMRNDDWTTNHKLWVNTCQVSPNSHNAWNNIGDDYDKLKDYASAIKGFTQSTIVKPNYADAYHNRANIFYKTGRLDLARESYNTALVFNPGLYQTYMSLIQIDLMEKKNDVAVGHAETAVKISPNEPQTAYVLAVVYAQVGRTTEAKTLLENVLKVYPNYKVAADALKQINSTPVK